MKKALEQLAKSTLPEAYKQAQKSPDLHTQNGAVLSNFEGEVLAWGFNRFPYGVANIPSRMERPLKYSYMLHAERACLYGTHHAMSEVLTCCWAACPSCAQTIIEHGVSALVTHRQAYDRHELWKQDIDLALGMLSEAGVEVYLHEEDHFGVGVIRFNGKEWEP